MLKIFAKRWLAVVSLHHNKTKMKKQPTKTQREAKEIAELCEELTRLSKDWATVREIVNEAINFLKS